MCCDTVAKILSVGWGGMMYQLYCGDDRSCIAVFSILSSTHCCLQIST